MFHEKGHFGPNLLDLLPNLLDLLPNLLDCVSNLVDLVSPGRHFGVPKAQFWCPHGFQTSGESFEKTLSIFFTTTRVFLVFLLHQSQGITA